MRQNALSQLDCMIYKPAASQENINESTWLLTRR